MYNVPLEIEIDNFGIECAKIKLPIIGENKCVFFRNSIKDATIMIPLIFCKIIEIDTTSIILGGNSYEISKNGAEIKGILIGKNLKNSRNYINIVIKKTLYEKEICIKQCKEIGLNKSELIPLLIKLGYNIYTHCIITDYYHIRKILQVLILPKELKEILL